MELAGKLNTMLLLYGPQVQPLPSEVRMAIQRSGALPSEILINSQAVGPLSPHGAMDYIPDQSPVQKARWAKLINLWGPAYGPAPQQTQNGPAAPTMPAGTPNGGYSQTGTGTATSNRGLNSAGAVQPQSPLYVDHYIQPQSLSAGYQVRSQNPYQKRNPETTTTTINVGRWRRLGRRRGRAGGMHSTVVGHVIAEAMLSRAVHGDT